MISADSATTRDEIYVASFTPNPQAVIPQDMPLPFFEPDFSDIKKLIDKIKILILFG